MNRTRRGRTSGSGREPKPCRDGPLTGLPVRLAAAVPLAALLAAAPPGFASAQNLPAVQPHHTPPAKLAATAKKITGPPDAATPASATGGLLPDPAFAAFQRGYYVTAFSLATQGAADQH